MRKYAALLSAITLATSTTGCSIAMLANETEHGRVRDVWVEGTYTPQDGCIVTVNGLTSPIAQGSPNQYEMYANSTTRIEAQKRFPRKALDADSVSTPTTLLVGCDPHIPSGRKGIPASLTPIDIKFLKTPVDPSVTGTLVITQFVTGAGWPDSWKRVATPTVSIDMANDQFSSIDTNAVATAGRVELTQFRGVIEKIHFKVLMRDPRRGE